MFSEAAPLLTFDLWGWDQDMSLVSSAAHRSASFNLTDTSDPFDYSTATLFILRYFLAVFGVISNLLLIFCVLFFKHLRETKNYFVVNLAIFDLAALSAQLAVFIPCSIIPKLLRSHFPYPCPVHSCYVTSLGNAITFVSLGAIILISLDRYLFILHGLHYNKFARYWYITTLGFSWLFCLGFWSLTGLLRCPQGQNPFEQVYPIINLVAFLLWFLIVAYIYFRILLIVYHQTRADKKRTILYASQATIADVDKPLDSSNSGQFKTHKLLFFKNEACSSKLFISMQNVCTRGSKFGCVLWSHKPAKSLRILKNLFKGPSKTLRSPTVSLKFFFENLTRTSKESWRFN